MRWAWAVILVTTAASACATLTPRPGSGWISSEDSVLLHDHQLKLHLTTPMPPRMAPLLVYATGDAGWFWKDRELFDHLATFGYPTVGFSAREYVGHLGQGVDVLRSGAVARDYLAVISTAKQALGMPPDTPVVLVGKSRGAGLAIAVASHAGIRRQLQGIIAVGLTREEEYVTSHLWHRPKTQDMFDTYAALADLRKLPVAIIQSTHDDYVPAAEARELLGSDTPDRQLRQVESRDHNFDGARDVMYQELQRELHWIVDR